MSHLDTRAARNTRRLLPLAMLIGAVLALPLNGYACGPDFPNRLLIDRNGTLLYMPEGNFAFEAGRLVPTDSQLPHWQAPPPPMPPKPMPQSPETIAIGKNARRQNGGRG
ncbi:Uncharacterised protein [Serratia marcescens]|uniref:Uncharacterized protein n=1 Tax=Serratia marcescens TaxID=615 RepID=A0A379Y7R4_SERMA|nr:Uncharacterised protein [Serratia marcescens]